MPRKIIEMVRERKAAMSQDPADAEKNAEMAVAAILGGVKSPEWKSYMLQFVEKDAKGTPLDPRQLQRLLAADDTAGDPTINRNRAYLASNGPCGAASPGGLGFDFTVEGIDQGLDDTLPPV